MFGATPIGVTLILGIAAVAAIGVPMNALFLQDGRHPAPLFSAQPSNAVLGAPTPPARRPAVIETARIERDPDVPTRATPKDLIASKIEKLDAAKSLDGGKSAPAKADPPHTADKKRDAIGLLIVGEPTPIKASGDKADKTNKADKADVAVKTASIDKNVLYAQRALLKLGYVVRSDGVLNGATRHALEKFEGDAGLPVKGRITPKLLQQLAARSRLPLP
jgi:hypothetical protein